MVRYCSECGKEVSDTAQFCSECGQQIDGKKVKEILKIPEHIQVVALTPLGYPAEKKGFVENLTQVVTQSKKRKSIDEIIHYDTW